MKNVNKGVLKVIERLMRNEAVQSAGKFPPICLGIRMEILLYIMKSKLLTIKEKYKIMIESEENEC